MAITVNIYYSGTNGNARKFAEEMISTGIVDEIRAEEGNLKYEYFFPMSDSETVLLIDIWKDQLALDIHHKSPLMSRIISLREKYNLTMKVERYITDEAGIPDRDKMFIKEKTNPTLPKNKYQPLTFLNESQGWFAITGWKDKAECAIIIT